MAADDAMTPERAMTEALTEWRPDYPWPKGDPAIVIAVALLGLERAGYEVITMKALDELEAEGPI